MTDGGVNFDSTATGPHVVTDEWLSFEARMRRRRVGRCLLRADLALDEGRAADARAAIKEARQLDPECPELVELETRLRALEGTVPESHADPLPACESAMVPAGGQLQSWRWVGSSAFVAILLTGTAVGSYYWRSSAPSEPVKLNPSGTATPRPALRIEQETVTAPAAAPDLVGDEPVLPLLPPMPAPPIADAVTGSETSPIVLAVNRDLPSPVSVPETPRSEMRLDGLPQTPSPEPPARPAPAAPAISTATDPVETEAAVTLAPKPEPKPVDESSIVLGVLNRYERAYSSLDAEAASSVWPGVDRTALERAFDGLASQRVSLQSCNVTVEGAAAHARCAGTATWVPKVGGGARTAVRRWDFELRKRAGAWEIERAVAR